MSNVCCSKKAQKQRCSCFQRRKVLQQLQCKESPSRPNTIWHRHTVPVIPKVSSYTTVWSPLSIQSCDVLILPSCAVSNDLPTQGVGSLSTLLKRLEAATSRLEDIAMAQAPPSGGTHAGALPQITSPATFVPEYNNNTASNSGVAATAPVASAETPAVRGFQELLTTSVAKYVGFSKEVGGVIAQQVRAVIVICRMAFGFQGN